MQDGAHALRDDHRRRAGQAAPQRAAQRPVGPVVQRRGAVVQHEDVRPRGQRPGDEQALLLPAGEVRAARGDRVGKAAFLFKHEIRLRQPRRQQQVLIRQAAAKVDALADGSARDEVVLEHHAEHRVQLLGRDALDAPPADADLARVRVVKAQQQADDGGFAAARRADDAQRLPAPERKAHVRQVVARLAGRPVVGEGDVAELHMIGALLRVRVAGQRVGGGLQHLLDAPGARRALGIDHKQARHHQQRVQDDRKIAQKRDDLARLRNAAVDAVRADDDHRRQPQVEQQAHHGVGQRHDGAGALVAPHDLAVDFVKAFRLIVRARERLDHAHAGHVLLHLAHHRVHRLLHAHIERHAPARDAEYDDGQQRERAGQREREHRLEHDRHADAAQQQDRPAHAQALHAVHHLVHVVGIGRQARDERGEREAVHLPAGEKAHARERVVAQPFDEAAGDVDGHAVGDHVAEKGRRRRGEHQHAPQIDQAHLPQRHDLIEDVREHPRQQQLRDGADEFDEHLKRHAPRLRAQVLENGPHPSASAPRIRSISARAFAAARSASAANSARSSSLKPSVMRSFHSTSTARTAGSASKAFCVG